MRKKRNSGVVIGIFRFIDPEGGDEGFAALAALELLRSVKWEEEWNQWPSRTSKATVRAARKTPPRRRGKGMRRPRIKFRSVAGHLVPGLTAERLPHSDRNKLLDECLW